MSYVAALLFACWCKRAVSQFALQINSQTFTDCNALFPLNITEKEFIMYSNLQYQPNYYENSFFILFPLIIYTSSTSHYLVWIILMLLCLLSVLDILYYLTSVHYVLAIFTCAIAHLLFYQPEQIEPHLFTLFSAILFFSAFQIITKWIYRQEIFGTGDAILFVALAPLFSLEQFAQLLLLSSLCGILFALIYWFIKKQKITKLPFIPFMSLATFIMLFEQY